MEQFSRFFINKEYNWMQTSVFSIITCCEQGYIQTYTLTSMLVSIWIMRRGEKDGVMTLEMRSSVSSSEIEGKKLGKDNEKYWNDEKWVEEKRKGIQWAHILYIYIFKCTLQYLRILRRQGHWLNDCSSFSCVRGRRHGEYKFRVGTSIL